MNEGFWVFGYGSLMWRPGFEHVERAPATLEDHHRSFCLASVRYRGTPESPGLVLGLEPKPGARCEGVAYRVAPRCAAEALAYLRERELVTKSYLEMRLPLRLARGSEVVEGVCYVIDQTHDQYRCGMRLEDQAEIIARAEGPMGLNADYLFNTLSHLRDLDVDDPEMERLAQLVKARLGEVSS